MLPLILLLLALVLLPGLWVRRVMRRHAGHRPDFRGDGAAFARHLLDEHGMPEVGVELTERGDHYDPTARMVRLSPENHAGRSLTAITVAAHEVGHAIQHHQGVGGLSTRTQLVGWAIRAERLGGGLMLAIPLLLILTRMPASGGLLFLGGALAFGSAALVHLVTLPVEWDASFRRALPILANGYLDAEDLAAARQILLAAALTYVGASLLSILNVWRWIAVLRR
jgi:Zn-dependent membrane protease YugP